MFALLATLMLRGSLTERLADFATNVVGDLGLPGIFLLMVPESACIPIPSEATMLFAGFNVSEGKYSLVAALVVACVGNLVGASIAYAVGYYGRLELLERHGHKLHITPRNLAWADRWFTRYGTPAVLFARMLPVIRTFISLPAGVARMPYGRFAALSLLGSIPWNLALLLIGKAARDNWDDWKDRLHYVDDAVVVLVLAAIAYYAVRRYRGRGGPSDAAVGVAE